VAAFNINGAMIHSMLSILIINDKYSKGLNIDGERLKQLQERLQGVHYVISMRKAWLADECLHKLTRGYDKAFPRIRMYHLAADPLYCLVISDNYHPCSTFQCTLPIFHEMKRPIMASHHTKTFQRHVN